MSESPAESDFLSQLTTIVDGSIADEKFGVSELADAMNMSRSNLLRKVKKETNLPVNQIIRDIRLKRAMELLQKNSFNVSEVAHQTGFNSTSYFIKCFRENYGYPPGEVGKRAAEDLTPAIAPARKNNLRRVVAPIAIAVVIAIGFLTWYFLLPAKKPMLERSIAVLPFKNDSSDSANVYLINGLMESTLNNLQKIEDLKVISRTSSEKYRNQRKSIPEMAKELNVSYFVEGSGQKIGNEILLNIQLIEGPTDKHLWSRQYKREVRDIFALQQEIAAGVAAEIQAVITPEEKSKIEKIPTENLEAYEFFLKGRDQFVNGNTQSLLRAIDLFKKAIELDKKFSQAYAGAAICYYYLDAFSINQKYFSELSEYSDKALLFDPKSDDGLVAKGLFYMQKKDYQQATLYFEKAIEYNPNSGMAINLISDLYNSYAPNTGKYLEYALMGVRVNVSADSSAASYRYMHLSNALIQTGFVDESLAYVNKALAYNPENPFAHWIKIGIQFAKDKNIGGAIKGLKFELAKDTMRFYLTQEIGKLYYSKRDYDSAYLYFNKFLATRDAQQLDMFNNESLMFAIVYAKRGMKKESAAFVKTYVAYMEKDKTVYKDIELMAYYAWLGDKQKAIEHLRDFSKKDNFQYWILLLAGDPLLDDIREQPEFKSAMKAVEDKFWGNHEKLKRILHERGLL